MDPDCRNDTTTVDLCSEPECINSTVTFEEAGRKTHLPSHGMFKVHRMIFDRDTARLENLARDALDSARGTVSQLKREGKPMPECAHCKTEVSLPCWCCVECTGEWEPPVECLVAIDAGERGPQARDSFVMSVNTSNLLSTRRTRRCIQ